MLRELVIDDAARATVAEVLKHADANHYRPWVPGAKVPGDDPRLVARLDTYRAVFSYTHSDGKIWRHLSVSVPGKKYPNPVAVFAIATLFGFTGWEEKMGDRMPDGWAGTTHKRDRAVVIVQAVRTIS